MAYTTITGPWYGGVGRFVVQIEDIGTVTKNTSGVWVRSNWFLEFTQSTWDASNTFDPNGSFEAAPFGPINIGTSSNPVKWQLIWEKDIWVNLQYGSQTGIHVAGNIVGINNVGTTIYVDQWFNLPARPYQLPNPPPAVTSTKNSDTQHTVSWTTDWTGSDGATPWHRVHVERWDNVTNSWTEIVNVSWDVTSYVDSTTKADRQYQYRARSYNSSGYSGYTTSGTTYTTPAAHSNIAWAKDEADIVLSWAKNSTMGVSTNIEESTNGGTSWAALTTVGSGVNTYRHAAPSASVTHTYRVRPTIGGLAGAWITSTTAQLLTNPLAPTNLTVSPGTFVDATQLVTLGWQYNTVDGSAQTAYELQYRSSTDNGATWSTWTTTGKVASTAKTRDYPAGTFTNGQMYQFQVRTWGAYATEPSYSPWSISGAFTARARPTITINSPAANAEIGTSAADVTLTYYSASEAAQASTLLELYNDTTKVFTRSISGSTTGAFALGYTLENNKTYRLDVTTTDVNGLVSTTASVTFTTDFIPPPAPAVAVAWEAETASVQVQVTNPPPLDGAPFAVSNDIYRSINGGAWVLIASGVPIDGAVVDRIPSTGYLNEYRAVAASATPTYSMSSVVGIAPTAEHCEEYLWINGGPGFSLVGRIRGNPSVSTTHSRDRVLRKYAGRELPVQYTGPGIEHSVSVQGILEGHDSFSTEAMMSAINDSPEIVLYRDPWGRRIFGAMDGFTAEQLMVDLSRFDLQTFSTRITKVDYAE